jgi:hypothetical protein
LTARGIESTTDCLSNASYVSTTSAGYRSISSKRACATNENDNGVKISTQDEERYQLEDDNIQRRFTSQESLKNQDIRIYLGIGSQITEEIYQKIHISVDKLEFEDQYGEEHESEEIQEDEIPANYKDREKQADGALKKDEAADEWIAEVGQETTSQMIYYSIPKNITLEDQLLGVYFP